MRGMFSQRMVVGMASTAILLLLGCAQPPTEQLGAAQQALDVAKAAGAADYAKNDFTALEQQFSFAKNELTKQENVLPIFRSYTDADKMLRNVVESGGRVAVKAAQGKESAKTAVLATEQEAGQVVASVKELIAKAPTGKARAAMETIKQDVEGLETSFNAVHHLIEMGDYFGAEIQAKAVGSSPTWALSSIPALERKDEIGYLTRVMHQMGVQIQSHLEQVARSEAALRVLNDNLSASESKYRGLVDNAPFGIFTTSGTKITFSNRYNQTLAGLDPDHVTDPDTFRQWIHPEDRERVLSEFAQAVETILPYETVFRFLHENGSVRKVLSRRIPIEQGTPRTPVYIGFNIDITALDQMQTSLSRAERLATLGQVAAGIAHEIRNPLVGIGANAFLLLDEFDVSDPRHADLEMILKETKRLDRIVNQIVDYARPRELAPELCPLDDLLNEAIKLLDSTLTAKRLTVARALPPTLARFQADRDQIKQVLLNVFQNAIDASRNGTAIDLTAVELPRGQQAGIVIKVTDHGVGIPDEALTHVFEPFFTRGKKHGTGLGLAICRNIIESHGGDIQITSEVGKGTSVRIWLPLRQEFQFVEG